MFTEYVWSEVGSTSILLNIVSIDLDDLKSQEYAILLPFHDGIFIESYIFETQNASHYNYLYFLFPICGNNFNDLGT